MEVEHVMERARQVLAMDLKDTALEEAITELWEDLEKLDKEEDWVACLSSMPRSVSQMIFNKFIRLPPSSRRGPSTPKGNVSSAKPRPWWKLW